MGHVINPISTRLGLNIFWNSNWSLNNIYNYNIMSKNNIFFFKFFNWIINFKKFKEKNIIFTHYIIYINNLNKIFFNIYFYWPLLDNTFNRRKKLIKWKYSNLKNRKKKFKINKILKKKKKII